MKPLLAQLVSGKTLDTQQAVEAFEKIMTGLATPPQIASLLSMVQLRGPTVQEMLGAAQVMRQKVRPVRVPSGLTVVDTCGTGADNAHTFNISTATAIVAAGAGRPCGTVVAKHGNRSVTSKSGSSQVLQTLGVNLAVTDTTLTRCLDETGLCFCFAPAHHPAMKHVAAVRQELGFSTLFNILGPLTNPAAAMRQVVGVFSADLTEPLAWVLKELGAVHVMVVHGQRDAAAGQGGGLDELTTAGMNRVTHLREGKIRTYQLDPQSLGLPVGDVESMRVDSSEASARTIQLVLSGQRSSARDIVCLNAAAVLMVADVVGDLALGIQMAEKAIDSGAAAAVLEKLIQITQADHSSLS